MDKKVIDAVQALQGDYEGLNMLLNCYDVWSATPAFEPGCPGLQAPAAEEER